MKRRERREDEPFAVRKLLKRPIISVEGITARFGEETILADVSFQVRRGETFAILGGSGCGKTVLLKHLIGLYRPYAGTVRVMGTDIAEAGGGRAHRAAEKNGRSFSIGGLAGIHDPL